jgi:PAS domain S-box-containing protein
MSEPLGSITAATDEHSDFSRETELAVLRSRVAHLEQESAEQKWVNDALKALVIGTASSTGQRFLEALARQLSAALNVSYVFVTEWVPGRTDRLRTIAGWCGNRTAEPLEYDVAESPCQQVFQDGQTFIPLGVRRLFPHDEYLVELGIESYMGVPLVNSSGQATGHLCVLDIRPFLFDSSLGSTILHAFAQRASAELERLRAEESLRRNEERFRQLYADNPSMYFTLSAEGTVMSVNRFGAEQLGYTEHELVGRSVLNVFEPDSHRNILEQLGLCAANPTRTFVWELQKVRKDGSRLWVRERARALPDLQGTPTILVVCEDITEHRETTRLLSTLVRESPLPIVSLDPAARVTSWNQAATRLFGWTEQEVLGRELPYVPPGDEAAADALWEEGTRGTVRGPIELRRRRKDGTVLDLLLWPVFVHGGSGELSTAVGLYVDQSDLKRAEAAKLKSEARLRSFLDALDDLAFEFDENGVYLNAWTRNEDQLLIPRHEIVGKTLSEVYGEPEGARYLAMVRRVLATGQPERAEYSLPLLGQIRSFSAILSRIAAVGDAPSTVACVVRDITDRKAAETALKESEARLRLIFDSEPECVKIVGLDGRIQSMNPAGLAAVQASSVEDVLGREVLSLVHADDRPAYRQLHERVCEGAPDTLCVRIRGLRGLERWMESHAVPLRDSTDAVSGVLCVTRDITEQKQASDQREQLSRDLHDNLLQSLYAVGMQLEAGKLVVGTSPRKSKTYMTRAIRQLNRLMLDVRQFIALLAKQAPIKADFGQALRQLVGAFSTAGHTPPELDITDPLIARITAEQAEELLNIAREALSNSMRHARAARRWVRLIRYGGNLRFQIGDDGVGFNPARTRTRGQGLANMAARAKRIHARFSLESRPRQGTCISIDFPMEVSRAHTEA